MNFNCFLLHVEITHADPYFRGFETARKLPDKGNDPEAVDAASVKHENILDCDVLFIYFFSKIRSQ